jgi:hypothetical protein
VPPMRSSTMLFAFAHVFTTRLVLASRLYERPYLYAELSWFSRVVVDVCDGGFPERGAEADAVEYTDMRELLTKLMVAG